MLKSGAFGSYHPQEGTDDPVFVTLSALALVERFARFEVLFVRLLLLFRLVLRFDDFCFFPRGAMMTYLLIGLRLRVDFSLLDF